MKITFIISRMSSSGGTERVMSILASEFASIGHLVTILTVCEDGKDCFYSLHNSIEFHRANILDRYKNPFIKFLYLPVALVKLRFAIRKTNPDVVVSFVDILNCMTIAAQLGNKTSVIVSEHFSPGIRKIGHIWEFARKHLYKYADGITVLTPEDVMFFPKSVRHKVYVLPNPAVIPNVTKTNYIDFSYHLISAGRLVKDKGFDILIEAIAGLKSAYPPIKLSIYGEGDQLDSLNKQIEELELKENVQIYKPISKLFDRFVESDIFVLPSRIEPFGMVIVEAMAVGLPVVATNCPNGPRNIINDGVDGFLVENENCVAIKEKIGMLFNDSSLREKIGNNAKKIVVKLSVKSFVDNWLKVIN